MGCGASVPLAAEARYELRQRLSDACDELKTSLREELDEARHDVACVHGRLRQRMGRPHRLEEERRAHCRRQQIYTGHRLVAGYRQAHLHGKRLHDQHVHAVHVHQVLLFPGNY